VLLELGEEGLQLVLDLLEDFEGVAELLDVKGLAHL
jgi:hypothetical protein